MKIAIFEPNPDFSTNPTLQCLVQALHREGAQIDVYMPNPGNFTVPEFGCTNYYPFPKQLYILTLNIRANLGNIKSFWQSRNLLRFITTRNYDLFIGVDAAGLITAHSFSKQLNIPFIYASFEITFRDELVMTLDIKEKQKEIIASREAAKIIIQDHNRAELLAKENGLDGDKFIYMPVAPSGTDTAEKTNYAREKFGIPSTETIVIHSGSFGEWTHADELIESARTWPDDFVLLIHNRSGPLADKYLQKIRRMNLPNVVLSTEFLSITEYELMLRSVDIGLVLIKSMDGKHTQKNIMNIGLSSGKFSFYMKYGLPVISITHQSNYRELLKLYKFGIAIPNFEEMPYALCEVRKNLDFFGSEAQRLFREKLDFDLYWPHLRSYILSNFNK